MTDRVWMELYGKGVNVQGQAIHCCTPTNPRPTEAILDGSNLTWWFPMKRSMGVIGFGGNFEGFPTSEIARLQRVNVEDGQTSVADLPLIKNVIEPLLEGMKSTHLAYKEEAGKIHCVGWFFVLVSWLMVLPLLSILPPILALKYSAYYWLLYLPIALIWLCSCYVDKRLKACNDEFWGRIRDQVVSFNAMAEEYGIGIELSKELAGPVDPNNPTYDQYKGPAIVFRSVSVGDTDGDAAELTEDEMNFLDCSDGSYLEVDGASENMA